MDLHVLFMQRKERYEGEFGPEALLAWDEYTIDENPPGFHEAVEKAKAAHADCSAGFALIKISIDGDKVRQMCLQQDHQLQGTVEDGGFLLCCGCNLVPPDQRRQNCLCPCHG